MGKLFQIIHYFLCNNPTHKGYQERLNEYLSFVRGHIVHIAISSYIIPDSLHRIKITHKFQGSSRTCIRATEAKPGPKLNPKIHLEKERNYIEARDKLTIPSNGFNEIFEDDSFNVGLCKRQKVI